MDGPYKSKPKKVYTLADLKSHKEGDVTLYEFPHDDGRLWGEEGALEVLRIANATGELTTVIAPKVYCAILDRLEAIERKMKI